MIPYEKISLRMRDAYLAVADSCAPRSCEFGFANLYFWGKQQLAFLHGCATVFSHFEGMSLYPYPVGNGDRRAVIQEILDDAAQRGIPCRISGITQAETQELESWFPGVFHFSFTRDFADYVYDIQELAELKGRKFQKKRNHLNRFRAAHPEARLIPMDETNLPIARKFVNEWFMTRLQEDPEGDYTLEAIALDRAFRNFAALHLEGALLMEGEEILAVTMASRLSDVTYDVHFEKAREDVEGAYTAINQMFADYLRKAHPNLLYLDREDDMGLAGLRKAKESYHPHHMEMKYLARLHADLNAEEESWDG